MHYTAVIVRPAEVLLRYCSGRKTRRMLSFLYLLQFISFSLAHSCVPHDDGPKVVASYGPLAARGLGNDTALKNRFTVRESRIIVIITACSSATGLVATILSLYWLSRMRTVFRRW